MLISYRGIECNPDPNIYNTPKKKTALGNLNIFHVNVCSLLPKIDLRYRSKI